jgi:hypothetical protein
MPTRVRPDESTATVVLPDPLGTKIMVIEIFDRRNRRYRLDTFGQPA